VTDIITRLDHISDQYDVVLCDLWGCLHNGKRAFPDAVAALQAFRAKGGTVVLLTNAPRLRNAVVTQLDGFGAPRDSYDLIVTSGDAAQSALAAGMYGRRVYHIGPSPKDDGFFFTEDGQPVDVTRVALADAEGIVCTGLFDDRTETPDDYRATILEGVNRGLKLLCANPDIIVDHGETRLYCAGAIAQAYTEAGGESHYFGKPYPPVYELARMRVTEHLGRIVPEGRMLAIGDGIATDVKGAGGEALDCLFITGGIAAEETKTTDQPEATALQAYLVQHQQSPRYAMGFLR